MIEGLALPIVCGLLGWAVARYIIDHAGRLGLIDRPSARSSHTKPTPRGGGMGIVIAMEVAFGASMASGSIGLRTWLVLAGCGAIVAALGFADDRWSLRASSRFTVHIAVALTVAWFACRLRQEMGAESGFLYGLVFMLMVLWCINSFNFMDGIDGIAATQALFMSASAAALNFFYSGPASTIVLLVCLAAASLGFLILNFPPAKVFMGDVASGFLGFTLALFAVAPLSPSSLPVSVWVILGGLFICDAGITVLRRIFRGDHVFEAHKMHAYQHLSRRWGSHLAVTLTYAAVNIIWLLPWAWYQARFPETWWTIAVALGPISVALFMAGAGRRDTADALA